MSTVGYGEMYPATLYGHVLVTIDVVTGVLLVPLATGLVIAKFTLPSARVRKLAPHLLAYGVAYLLG